MDERLISEALRQPAHIARYETVVCEDLNVAGMTRNRRLARAISGQGFGTAVRMLSGKTGTAARQQVAATRSRLMFADPQR